MKTQRTTDGYTRGLLVLLTLVSTAVSAGPPPVEQLAGSLCIWETPALGDDGKLFAAAGPSCESVVDQGIAAIDPENGAVLWGPVIPDICKRLYRRFGAHGPSVGANGLVYAVGDWNQCTSGRIAAMSAADGSIVWDRSDCPGGGNRSPHPRQVPALDDSIQSLYHGTSVFCAADMDTGLNKWTSAGGRYIGEGGMAIDSRQNVTYGSNGGNGLPVALFRSFSSDGTLLWQRDGGARFSSVVAVGAGDTLLLKSLVDDIEALAAWDSDGVELWRAPGLGRPALDESGFIYAGSETTAEVASLHIDGTERWRTTLPEETRALVDFVDDRGRVYVRGESTLYALSTADGSVAWSHTVAAALSAGAVLVPGGKIFLADKEKNYYLLDACVAYARSDWPVALYGNRRHTQKVADILELPRDCGIEVAIDVKPGSSPNTVNLSSGGVLPVAILSSATFDALQVDPDTIRLAGAPVRRIGNGDEFQCQERKANADELPDLVCHVETDQLVIEEAQSVVTLEAETFAGVPVQGQDEIRITPGS